MDSKKKQNLEESYERILNVGFCKVPYEDLSDIIGPNPMVFGTTKDEKILSFEDLEALFKSQFEQKGDMESVLDRKRIAMRISNDGNNAFIVEEITLTLSSPEAVHTIFMRASCVMEYLKNQWKLTHWHTSTPVDTENDPWHMEEWKREKEKLQQLVDEQTAALKQNNRELQIEAALEKIRSSSLTMQKTDDLRDVVKVLFEQMQGLSVDMGFASVSIFIFEDGSRNIRQWLPLPDGVSSLSVPYFDHPISSDLFDAKESGEDFFTKIYTLEEKNTWIEHGFEHTDYRDLPVDFKSSLLQASGYAMAITLAKNSGICIPSFEGKLPTPENIQIMKRVGKVFEQAYIRFLDLQKAEAQAREARIEAALERVRSRSLAMHKSSELKEVIIVVFEKLKELGLVFEGAGIQLFTEGSKDIMQWVAAPDHLAAPILAVLPYTEEDYKESEIVRDMWMAKEKGENVYNKSYSINEKDKFFIYAGRYNDFDQIPESVREFQMQALGYTLSLVAERRSALWTDSYFGQTISEEGFNVLKRTAKVFDQAYTRFLDLQKAEAQAREAQIEASLERVRSRTMAMQLSDELTDVAMLLFQQVKELGIKAWTTGFNVWQANNTAYIDYVTDPSGHFLEPYIVDLTSHPAFEMIRDAKQKGDDFFVSFVEGEQIAEMYQLLNSFANKGQFQKILDSGFQFPTHQFNHIVFGAQVSLLFVTYEACPEGWDIFRRFGKVFEQTYTRFLDLQKAEAQAREAQIESALERVRSRTMAMHSSQDVDITVTTLFDELLKLGVDKSIRSGIGILDKSRRMEVWTASTNPSGQTALDKGILDMGIHQLLTEVQEAWEAKKITYSYELIGDDLIKYFKAINDAPEYSLQVDLEKLPGKITHYDFFFPEGFLFAFSPTPLSAEISRVFMRFASVFGQTYRRYLDLQKAEAQAREATKQASLDRVRGIIASMRSAADLELITPLIFKELTILGVPFIRCGVFIIDEKQELVNAYLSSPEGNSLGVLRLHYNASVLTQGTVEAWGKGEIYRQHWNKEDFVQWINIMMQQDQIQDSRTYQGAAVPPESLDLHFVPFTQGMLYVGAISPLDERELELVTSLAKAFSIAYARYEDFEKLDKAKSEIESALSELKATQSQLVQQEKLASLGQLTAGIAHEIKNPLNFVNNFSEVSMELIEEAKEERSKSQESRDETLVDEILEDIKSNLTKIHEHGTRANGIVTSMLQHSRGGSGKIDSTDLNALVKEYVNLSFHGMRAAKNPIDVEIDFELDPDIGDVPIIKEDFIRVIINLCNNAFDAMRQKTLQGFKTLGGLEVYQPRLTVRTKSEKDHILIEVADNGSGIPDDIKDKILQPFFTTKKGTEGTGLGLSITHDIVKAHGGELRIESTIGKGSEFVIQLPIS